jgi:hypothetical protein
MFLFHLSSAKKIRKTFAEFIFGVNFSEIYTRKTLKGIFQKILHVRRVKKIR